MKRVLLVLAGAALLAGGCSTVSVSTDYDKSVDFAAYRTFAWHDSGEIKDGLWAKRIEGVLSDALAAKGLRRVEGDADVWLTAHTSLSKETQVNTYNSGWGYGYGWYGGYGGGMATTTVTQIPVGTLFVDLVDGKKKELVWRGVAKAELNTDPSRSPEDREKKLRDVATEMFAGYPPKK